nr:hypothetical protein CFP56_75620 [Quercus suber]
MYGIDLSCNNLAGKIPPELGRISNNIRVLNLSHNNLSGPIPVTYSNLLSKGDRKSGSFLQQFECRFLCLSQFSKPLNHSPSPLSHSFSIPPPSYTGLFSYLPSTKLGNIGPTQKISLKPNGRPVKVELSKALGNW